MWKVEHRSNQLYRGKRKRSNALQVPTSADILLQLKQLSNTNRYHTMKTPMLTVQFRFSTVPRRDNTTMLDIDIVQIEIKEAYQKKGNGIQFFKNVIEAAKELEKGVYLEQCITPASQAWRKRLIELKLALPYKEEIFGEYNAISVDNSQHTL